VTFRREWDTAEHLRRRTNRYRLCAREEVSRFESGFELLRRFTIASSIDIMPMVPEKVAMPR